MKKIIYLSGIDGAGKTSVSKEIYKHYYAKKIKAYYTWGGLTPVLLKPLSLVAKLLFVRKLDKNNNYSIHKKHKQKSINKFKYLMSLQFIIALADYYPQYLFKVYFRSKLNEIIIIDRYYLDFFIERGILANWTLEQTYNKIIDYQRLFLNPTDFIYLKINPEIALKRKDDIPSIDYLNDRERYYNYIHARLNSFVIDGGKSLDEVVEDIRNIL